MKEIKITNVHSSHNPTQKIKLELQGGSPYFCYIWIDDECYSLTKKRTAKLKKVIKEGTA